MVGFGDLSPPKKPLPISSYVSTTSENESVINFESIEKYLYDRNNLILFYDFSRK